MLQSKSSMIKAFFSFILIILLAASTLGYTINQLQKPKFLTTQAREINLYGRVSGQLNSLIDDKAVKDLPLNKSDLVDVIKTAVDAETFYQFLDGYANTYLDWLTGRSDTLTFQYNLTPVKDRARDKATERLLRNYADLPVCQANQLKNWQVTNGLPSCKLVESNIRSNDIETSLKSQVESKLAGIPDQFTAPAPTAGQLQYRSLTMRLLKIIQLTWLATAIFLLLFVLILRRRAFGTLAAIFLVAGLIEIGFSLIGWDWLGQNVVDLLGNVGANYTAIITALLGAVLEVLKTILGNLSIFCLSFGVLMLIAAIIFRVRTVTKMVIPRS